MVALASPLPRLTVLLLSPFRVFLPAAALPCYLPRYDRLAVVLYVCSLFRLILRITSARYTPEAILPTVVGRSTADATARIVVPAV